MTQQWIEFQARRFFPHLRHDHAIQCIEVVIKNPRPETTQSPRTDYIGAPLEAMRPDAQRQIAIPKVDQ